MRLFFYERDSSVADLNEIDRAGVVKLAGSNPASGITDNYMQVDANGTAQIGIYNAAGSAITSVTNGAHTALDVFNQANGPVTPGTVASFSNLMGGQYNSTLPTLTSGQQAAIQTDANGRLLVSSSPLPTTASKFSFGDITTTNTALVPVSRTTYTEQTANAAMTIVSSNANDSSAGTGARTVTITYFDVTMAGPNTVIIAMNGTTAVTASVSNMCFIEKMVVATVGSTGNNVGIITLKSGATTVGTIAAGDNQTFWAHHYVPAGKISYISGFSINSSSTTTGSGGLFVLKASTPTVANTPELIVSDFHRLYGQNSSTDTRNYLSPIQVTGPARIRAYVAPETTTSTVYRASFDFIDN